MTKRELQEIFTEDPVMLATIEGKEFILTGISLGNVARISAITEEVLSLVSDDLPPYEWGCYINEIARIIAIACHNGKTLPHPSDISLLTDFLTASQLLVMLENVYKRMSFDELWKYYQFDNKSSSDEKFKGQGSLWSYVNNYAIHFKGWSEYDIKWKVSFQNIVITSMCTPKYDSEGKLSESSQEPVDLFEFLEKR
ncbi:hypothetical protein ACS126_09885 [Sphingobacterium lactis]|uniref:hypothetical protein n=1 Tax=Sphingobacterium lactis TaxID=797291 RepID=UPI003EC6C0AE